MLVLDISKFFPNTNREIIYQFYHNKLNTSSDIANILTNLSTVDLNKCQYDSIDVHDNVNDFIITKNVRTTNHLISGASTSSYLSFLVHYDMFQEIQSLLTSHQRLSIYVDDITISSKYPIKVSLKNEIAKILCKYNHRLSDGKVKLFTKTDFKKTTGVIITPDNSAAIPNRKRNEIMI